MIRKDKNWKWDKKQKELFKKIKNKFTEELSLKIYKLELPIRVEMDLLDFALEAYMVQKYIDGI